MELFNIILAAVGAAAAAGAYFGGRSVGKKLKASEDPPKKLTRLKKLLTVLSIAGIWLFVVELLTIIFGKSERGEFMVELTAERVSIFGISVSTTIILTWIIIAVLTVVAALIRIFAVPRFTDTPKGLQNVLETAVGELDRYIESKLPGMGVNFGAYIFTLAAFMIGCAVSELFGVRAPTADITMTASMALITFVLINYFGIRKKGIGGRVKSLASPTPLVFPIRVICDCAVPVSMACRLFGNMLGGMIVMDLLYYALGNASIAIPSVVGLYFNVFHPLIQAFIFVTLTLTFIGEATE